MRGSTALYIALSLALILFISKKAQAAIAPSRIAQNVFPPPPTPGTPAASVQPSTLAFVRAREGLRLSVYPDAGGYSIGYGHYLGSEPTPASITSAQAETWLAQDINAAAIAIARNVNVPLSQNQYDALISFVYNVGAGAFAGSTLLAKLNSGDYTGAAAEFDRWTYSKGVVDAGLKTRRSIEKSLFLA